MRKCVAFLQCNGAMRLHIAIVDRACRYFFESSLYSLRYHYLIDLLCFLADSVDLLELDDLNSSCAILVCQLLISSSFSHLLTLDVRI